MNEGQKALESWICISNRRDNDDERCRERESEVMRADSLSRGKNTTTKVIKQQRNINNAHQLKWLKCSFLRILFFVH